jgi:hypothetical protein
VKETGQIAEQPADLPGKGTWALLAGKGEAQLAQQLDAAEGCEGRTCDWMASGMAPSGTTDPFVARGTVVTSIAPCGAGEVTHASDPDGKLRLLESGDDKKTAPNGDGVLQKCDHKVGHVPGLDQSRSRLIAAQGARHRAEGAE